MRVLAGTTALVIDLRDNRGGSPDAVVLLASYLVDADDEPVHLNTLEMRSAGITQQYWTAPFVPGPRSGRHRPLYVLTSAETFSADEEFSYDLQALRRAVIVGETTGGGAHVGDRVRLDHHLVAFIPTGARSTRSPAPTGTAPASSPTSSSPASCFVPPARITSRSSMHSAPAAIPAMIDVSFPAGFTPAAATRVQRKRTRSPISSDKPARSASTITGASPANDTRFASSKIGVAPAHTSGSFTISAFSDRLNQDLNTPDSSIQKALSRDQHAGQQNTAPRVEA